MIENKWRMPFAAVASFLAGLLSFHFGGIGAVGALIIGELGVGVSLL